MKPFQQRRSFLLAAVLSTVSKTTTMRAAKRASLSLATAISAALLFSSCASLTPERIDALIAIAGQAAQIGTQIWLEKHPSHRQAFEQTSSAVSDALRNGDTNKVVELFHSLPTSVLEGPEGAVYFTTNRIVVWDDVAGKSYVASPPMFRAAVTGFRRGVMPLPPKPAGRVRRLPPPMPESEAPPLPDAELDKQFEEVKSKLSRTTDYVVERKDGTNWHPAVLITNAPVGEWRIRRR